MCTCVVLDVLLFLYCTMHVRAMNTKKELYYIYTHTRVFYVVLSCVLMCYIFLGFCGVWFFVSYFFFCFYFCSCIVSLLFNVFLFFFSQSIDRLTICVAPTRTTGHVISLREIMISPLQQLLLPYLPLLLLLILLHLVLSLLLQLLQPLARL